MKYIELLLLCSFHNKCQWLQKLKFDATLNLSKIIDNSYLFEEDNPIMSPIHIWTNRAALDKDPGHMALLSSVSSWTDIVMITKLLQLATLITMTLTKIILNNIYKRVKIAIATVYGIFPIWQFVKTARIQNSNTISFVFHSPL